MEPTNQREAGKEVAKLSQVIQIDEGKIEAHLGEVVRSTVEETLNALLDAEADRLCQAERYERTEARKDTRAGLPDAGGFLPAAVAHQNRSSEFEGSETAQLALRDGHHRALQAAREFGRRSAGGDVSPACVGQVRG